MIQPIDFRPLLDGTIRSFRFEGADHGDVEASFFLIHYLDPGTGPGLHTHPYPEIFVTLEGEALMTVGNEQRVVRAGDIVVAPANTPHKFVSQGDIPLKQVDIHCSSRMVQVDLE